MHPAYSVIAFTTLSGAGYGVFAWLALMVVLGRAPQGAVFGLTSLVLGAVLVSAGLLSSTAHLGRPERAWRAFSQWRTSWLSREGVLAVATYVPAGLLGLAFLLGIDGAPRALAALALLGLSVATVWSTGMIYQSLPTIRAWHQPLVAPIYVALALATGAVAMVLLLALAHRPAAAFALTGIVALGLAWALKAAYWSAVDGAARDRTIGRATGLGRIGAVRPLDPPHTQANFVMREMGYQVARRHAEKLRRIVTLALFAGPMAALALILVVPGSASAVVLALAATASTGIGAAVERWLFFAEAEHVVTLYYGREAA